MIERRGFRLRLTLAGMMTLVAIVAVAIFFLTRGERERQAKIGRAVAIIHKARPDLDLADYEPRIGSTSADGFYVQVKFASRTDRQKQFGVVIPRRDAAPGP